MTRLEIETIIMFNDAEEEAEVGTRSKRIMNRFKKLGVEPNDNQAGYSWYRVPKTWIRYCLPKKASEKQKEAARKNIIKARNLRKTLSKTEGNKKNLPDKQLTLRF